MKRLSLFLSILFALTLILSPILHAPLLAKEETYPTVSMKKDLTLADCVFFGDSTTYGLFRFNAHNDGRFGKNYYTLQDSQIWTPKSGTFYLGNLLNLRVSLPSFGEVTLTEALKAHTPSVFVITVGINGLTAWDKDTFLKYYEKLLETVEKASPKTITVLQSVYPIGEAAREKLPHFTNEKINEVNAWIALLAKKKNLCFLDTASLLKNEMGALDERFHNGDGLHLSTEGFNRMLQNLEAFLSRGDV